MKHWKNWNIRQGDFFLSSTLATQWVHLPHVGWHTNKSVVPTIMHTYQKKFKHYFYLPFTEQGTLLLYPSSVPGKGPHHDYYSPSARNVRVQLVFANSSQLSLCQRDRQRDSVLFVYMWVIGSTKCREWFTTTWFAKPPAIVASPSIRVDGTR